MAEVAFRSLPTDPGFLKGASTFTRGLLWELARIADHEGVLFLGDGSGARPLAPVLATMLRAHATDRSRFPRAVAELVDARAIIISGDHLRVVFVAESRDRDQQGAAGTT